MKQITDDKVVNSFIKKNKIDQKFDTLNLKFSIYKYKRGEFIRQPMENSDVFHFIVEGKVSIYFIREDGSKYSLASSDSFFVLGDMELLETTASKAFAEALTDVTSVGISLSRYRSQLTKDKRFLYFIVQTLSQRIATLASAAGSQTTLSEKVLNHMKYHCEDQILSGLERTSFQLHCSDRQLQRILNDLVLMNKIKKCGKGKYRLI